MKYFHSKPFKTVFNVIILKTDREKDKKEKCVNAYTLNGL